MAVLAADAPPESFLKRHVPILSWLPAYKTGEYLRPDLVAGITIAAFSVPESMAYAGLAGLPAQYGLYASLVGLIVYCILGSSPKLSVGVTSSLSIMIAGSLAALSLSGPDEYLAAAQLTAIVAGSIAILAAVLKLEFIVSFISEAVLTGFSTGAALYIASSQFGKLLGIPGADGNFFQRTWYIIKNIGDTSGWTLAVATGSLAALLILDKLYPRLPVALIVVLASILLMAVSNLEDRGVEIAGEIPRGLPGFGLSTFPSDHLGAIIGLAFGCFLLSYVEGISVARTFAIKDRTRVDARQELVANGGSNVVVGLLQGFNVGGSMSRSAVADEAGGRTPLAGGIAGVVLALVVLFLTGLFEQLPEATLGAIVIFAVRHLVKIEALKKLWHVSRPEFYAAIAATMGVLVFDMLYGILIGAAVSMLLLIKRTLHPSVREIVRDPATGHFVDALEHQDVRGDPDTLIVRIEGGLYYANAQSMADQVEERIAEHGPAPKQVILSLGRVPQVDLETVEHVLELRDSLKDRGISLRIADASEEVIQLLEADAREESISLRPIRSLRDTLGPT